MKLTHGQTLTQNIDRGEMLTQAVIVFSDQVRHKEYTDWIKRCWYRLSLIDLPISGGRLISRPQQPKVKNSAVEIQLIEPWVRLSPPSHTVGWLAKNPGAVIVELDTRPPFDVHLGIVTVRGTDTRQRRLEGGI